MIIFKVTQLTILMKIQIEVSEAERANWVAGHVTTLISQAATIVHDCDDENQGGTSSTINYSIKGHQVFSLKKLAFDSGGYLKYYEALPSRADTTVSF